MLSLSMGLDTLRETPQDSGLRALLKGRLTGKLVPHTATAVKKKGVTGNTGQGGRPRSCGGLNMINSSRLCLECDSGDCGCGLQPSR